MGIDGRAEAVHAIHAVQAILIFGVAVEGAICVLHGSEAAISSGATWESARDEAEPNEQPRDSAGEQPSQAGLSGTAYDNQSRGRGLKFKTSQLCMRPGD